MTTMKNLVKTMFMNILTAGIFATAFTACSDELEIDMAPVAPEMADAIAASKDPQIIENEEYSIPVEVKADGEWRLGYAYDVEGLIGEAWPKTGNGNTTVQLYVSKNNSGQERESEMYVISTLTGDTLQRVPMIQKADNITRASELVNSNRIYGAGYGYNCMTGEMTSSPMVLTEQAIKDTVLVTGGADADYIIQSYTGSCFSQLCNDLSVKGKMEGKKGGFEGEISAAFDMNSFQESKHDYVMNKVDAVVNSAHFEADCQEISLTWLTTPAYNSINGLSTTNPKNGRVARTRYPSTNEGFKLLIKEYGTHFIRRCKLGGRLTYATTIDLSKVEDNYNISAYAKCSYSNSILKAKAEVEDSLTNVFKKNSKAINTRILVTGGGKTEVMNLASKDDDTNINKWISSLQDGTNTVVVDLKNANMIPLYELVEDETRAKLLKEYMENGQMYKDFSEDQGMNAKNMGTMPHIKNIDKMFSKDLNYRGSLVKDIYVSGTLVARVCAEFIPTFSRTERSIVIYPVCDSWAKYNMGYFVGNEAWRPQHVCFLDNGEFTYFPVSDTEAGMQKELYMSGSAFFAPTDDVVKVAKEKKPETTVKDAYMECKSWNNKDGDFVRNEPIVKIFNRIWARTRYNEKINHSDGGWWAAWYGPEEIKKFSIQNWYMASTADYEGLFNYLKKANISLPAQYMSNVNGGKDLTGFNIEFNEGWKWGNETNGTDGKRMLYMTGTRTASGGYETFRFVEFFKTGEAGFMPNKLAARDVNNRMFVRMVQPMKMKVN